MRTAVGRPRLWVLLLALCASAMLGVRLPIGDTVSAAPHIPTTWDETALAGWATPVAGLNVRPTIMSVTEYYAMSVENVRTYPVYFPGREPEGYWEMLQHVGPQPLIEPTTLATEADWIRAGERVFDEADHLHLRTWDATLIAAARNPERFKD